MPGRRRSLVGTAARTAVVVGTATAVSGSVANSQQQKAVAQQQAAEQKAAAQQAQVDAAVQQALAQQAPAAPPPAEPAPAAPALTMEEKVAQLTKLGELKAAGVLSDAEFEVMKAKVLNG